MTPRTMILDWRGAPNLSRPADFYSVASTHEKRPEIGNPNGKLFVAISSTTYNTPSGLPVARPYNIALDAVVLRYAATLRSLDPEPNGYYATLFDITRRGVIREWLSILDERFPWADGYHVDWFSAWSWAFPEMAPMDAAWDSALAALAQALRSRGKLVLSQQFHLTSPVLATNGAFCEQSPFAFRYTLAKHEEDLSIFRSFTGRVDPREVLWVQEVRDPGAFTKEIIDEIKAWAVRNDAVLSFGRDAQAGALLS